METVVDIIGWMGVGGAAILFVVGLIELVVSWHTNRNIRKATDNAAKVSDSVATSGGAQKELAGIDFKGQWEALAALALALKDLDRSTRMFFLSLAFLAIAGATVGLAEVAAGIGST